MITGDFSPKDIVRLKKDWSWGLKKDNCLVITEVPGYIEDLVYCQRYGYCYPIEKKYLEVIGWVSK